MKDETLKELIESLNKDNLKDCAEKNLTPIKNAHIKSKNLSKKICYIKISDKTAKNTVYEFYFIQNNNKLYVSVVGVINYPFDNEPPNDLHFYTLEENRKNGHLKNALKETILHHLFLDRNNQYLTINKDNVPSINLAKKLGFQHYRYDPCNEHDIYLLRKCDFF
jgi:RimJ/RimL family protein N-acetyltransferase